MVNEQTSLLRTQDLTLTVPTEAAPRTLIQSLNWSVQAEECWVIIGRNGAGKSTLLKSVLGLLPTAPQAVWWQEKTLPDWPLKARAKHCAYLPQSQQDAFGYTVQDVVLAARYPHVPGYWENAAEMAAIQAVLSDLDISHLAQRDVRTLSGGERQRTAIAALLAQDTPLLLLDEPASALDLAHQMQLMQQLKHLRHSTTASGQARGMVLISHDLNLSVQVATHALLLMPDGTWLAGAQADVLRSEHLSTCLGYPVNTLEHQGQRYFVPQPQ